MYSDVYYSEVMYIVVQWCEVEWSETHADAQHCILCVDVPYNKVMCGDVQCNVCEIF